MYASAATTRTHIGRENSRLPVRSPSPPDACLCLRRSVVWPRSSPTFQAIDAVPPVDLEHGTRLRNPRSGVCETSPLLHEGWREGLAPRRVPTRGSAPPPPPPALPGRTAGLTDGPAVLPPKPRRSRPAVRRPRRRYFMFPMPSRGEVRRSKEEETCGGPPAIRNPGSSAEPTASREKGAVAGGFWRRRSVSSGAAQVAPHAWMPRHDTRALCRRDFTLGGSRSLGFGSALRKIFK